MGGELSGEEMFFSEEKSQRNTAFFGCAKIRDLAGRGRSCRSTGLFSEEIFLKKGGVR
jgi:hypothetical protein